MDVAQLLELSLRAAGVPILGVRIGDITDRRTWSVRVDPSATPEQRATGIALVQQFDPLAPSVIAAVTEGEARAVAGSRQIRAFWLWWYRETHGGKDPTDEERATAITNLVQAYKDTPDE